MRIGLVLNALFIALGYTTPLLGQDTESSVRFQASGVVSEFRYARGGAAKWRGSTAFRFRVLVQELFFGELSFATPLSGTGPVECPGLEECPPGAPYNKRTDWNFSVLAAAIGF